MLAHLDFFDATSETASLASGILGALPLLRLIARLGRNYVTRAPMGLGIIAGGRDIGVRGGRTRGREEVSVARLGEGEGTDYVMLSAMGLSMGGKFSGG